MTPTEHVTINGSKLATVLLERGLSRQEVSKGLHYNHGYITQAISRGYLSAQAMELLAIKYNIKREDIAPDPDPETETAVEKAQTFEITEDTVKRGKEPIDYFIEKLENVLNEHTMSLLLIEASVEAALAKKGL